MLYINNKKELSLQTQREIERNLVKKIGSRGHHVGKKGFNWKSLPFYKECSDYNLYIIDNGALHKLQYNKYADTAIYNTKYDNYVIIDSYFDTIVADGDTALCIVYDTDTDDPTYKILGACYYDFSNCTIKTFNIDIKYKTNVMNEYSKCKQKIKNFSRRIKMYIEYNDLANPSTYKKLFEVNDIRELFQYANEFDDTFNNIMERTKLKPRKCKEIYRRGDYVIIETTNHPSVKKGEKAKHVKEERHIIVYDYMHRVVCEFAGSYDMISLVGRRMYFTNANIMEDIEYDTEDDTKELTYDSIEDDNTGCVAATHENLKNYIYEDYVYVDL